MQPEHGGQDIVYKLNRDLLRIQGKRSSNTSEAIEKGELLSSDEREACLFALPYLTEAVYNSLPIFVVLTFKL